MRTTVTILILASLAGCYPKSPPRHIGAAQPEPRATDTDPRAITTTGDASGKGAVMAYVNDRPVYMADLHDLLVRAYGLKLAQHLLLNELVSQEAKKKGAAVTAADIRHQHDRTLMQLAPEGSDRAQRERFLDNFLAMRNMSRKQWDLVMRRNALLAKLISEKIEVTEAELQREFGRRYGRQVIISHIQTAALSDAQKVLKLLTDGGDFAKLAAKHSINPSGRKGGLLPQFGKDSQRIAPAIREAALAMTKVGEISNPVMAGTSFHILKLEKIIDPVKAKFADVKKKLEVSVRWHKGQFIQQRCLNDLIRKGSVRYVDPILKARADEGAKP